MGAKLSLLDLFLEPPPLRRASSTRPPAGPTGLLFLFVGLSSHAVPKGHPSNTVATPDPRFFTCLLAQFSSVRLRPTHLRKGDRVAAAPSELVTLSGVGCYWLSVASWARPVNSSNASRRSSQPGELVGPPFSGQHHAHEDRCVFDTAGSPFVVAVRPGIDLPEIEELPAGRIFEMFDHPCVSELMRQDVGSL